MRRRHDHFIRSCAAGYEPQNVLAIKGRNIDFQIGIKANAFKLKCLKLGLPGFHSKRI